MRRGLNRRNYQRPYIVPDDATEIIVVRHGSAAFRGDSSEILIGGQSDPPLAPRGHEQARIVAECLRDVEAGALCISTLTRTAETAAPIADVLGLTPIVVPDLREIMLGAWEVGGLAARDDALVDEVFKSERWEIIPGAEPMKDFSARVTAALTEVAAAAGDSPAAIAVTHGAVIAEACRQATGSSAFAFLGADNTSITRIVRHADGTLTLRSYNETSHLRDYASSSRALSEAG
jgi:probable phosphoglycerate mutase